MAQKTQNHSGKHFLDLLFWTKSRSFSLQPWKEVTPYIHTKKYRFQAEEFLIWLPASTKTRGKRWLVATFVSFIPQLHSDAADDEPKGIGSPKLPRIQNPWVQFRSQWELEVKCFADFSQQQNRPIMIWFQVRKELKHRIKFTPNRECN